MVDDLSATAIDRRSTLAMGIAAIAASARAEQGPRRSPPGSIVINSLGEITNPNARPAQAATGAVARADNAIVDERAIADAHASGLTAVNITLGYVAGKDDPFPATVRDIALWDQRIRSRAADLVKVYTAADIVQAHAQGKIGIIYGFQNAAMMADDASRVDIFAGLGVRVIQLTYNPRNQLGCGSTVADNCGLSDFGREVVERLNANRVIVDLSHSGEQTCLDAIRASKQPIAITHTGCRALSDLPRNKTDRELRMVAERGGYVGIYFMLYLNAAGRASAADLVRHIEHAVNLCGEDHVGIGTDGTITSHDDMPAYLANFHTEYAARAAAGIAAPGEGPDRYPFLMDLRGPGQFRQLARLLTARGFTQARVDKILGGNFLAYARSVWGG